MAERIDMLRDEMKRLGEHVNDVKKEKWNITLRIKESINDIMMQVGYCPMAAQFQQVWKQREMLANQQINAMSQSVETCVAMQGVINHFRVTLLRAFDEHLTPPLSTQLSTPCLLKGTSGETQTNEMVEVKEEIVRSLEDARHQEEMCMDSLCALLTKVGDATNRFESTLSAGNQSLEKRLESQSAKIEEELAKCSRILNVIALMKEKVNSVYQNFSGI